MALIKFSSDFQIEDEVFVKSDPEQYKRYITAIQLRPNNNIIYYVSWNGIEEPFYNFELSHEKDVVNFM